MNGNVHALIGILLLLVFSLFNINGLSAFLFLFGNSLPDIIEPANGFNHRKFFHSQRILLYITALITVLFLFNNIVAFLLLGYITHLLCDSFTPMGLPF